jgi:hypothetical protein
VKAAWGEGRVGVKAAWGDVAGSSAGLRGPATGHQAAIREMRRRAPRSQDEFTDLAGFFATNREDTMTDKTAAVRAGAWSGAELWTMAHLGTPMAVPRVGRP